jgi:hypothetical protein
MCHSFNILLTEGAKIGIDYMNFKKKIIQHQNVVNEFELEETQFGRKRIIESIHVDICPVKARVIKKCFPLAFTYGIHRNITNTVGMNKFTYFRDEHNIFNLCFLPINTDIIMNVSVTFTFPVVGNCMNN